MIAKQKIKKRSANHYFYHPPPHANSFVIGPAVINTHSGLLVLRAGRRRVGNLNPLECPVEEVELLKKEFAVAVFLGACLRLLV